jgi:c(7)-type cytochrome triheme protein
MSRRSIVLAVIVGAMALTSLPGCSTETREKILPYVFDGFSDAERRPRPPTRRVRRELLQEIDQLKRELADARETAKNQERPAEERRIPVEQVKQWQEVSELLPKSSSGRVDWVQALKAGTIAPRPAIDPKKPGHAPLDLDVELTPPESPAFTVIYPHAPHTEWLTCASCHPAIFPLKRQTAPLVITMAKIRNGEYCGVCHGKVAFGVEGECARCHPKVPARAEWRPVELPRKPIERAATWEEAQKLLPVAAGAPDWAKALVEGVIAPRPSIDPKEEDQPVFPLNVELTPADAPAFKVVFPHETHTAILSCLTCHPAIFQMAAGADPITMEKIFAGEYCGRCHGKVAFLPATACGRCHPVMAGGG